MNIIVGHYMLVLIFIYYFYIIFWERLQKALEYLVAHYPNELMRIKGMVYTPGQNEPLLVQGTAGRF